VAKTVKLHLTVGKAVEAVRTLAQFATYDLPHERGFSVEWSRLKFAISRTFAALCAEPCIIAGEKAHNEAIAHNALTDSTGKKMTGVWPHQPEAWAAFLAEWTPVAAQEMDITIPPLPACIQNYCPPGVVPNQLVSLLPFIGEE